MPVVAILHRIATDGNLPCRPVFADFASSFIYSWMFSLVFCLSHRPPFAALTSLMMLAGLWIANNAKRKALRNEPLVITDLALAWQVIRFPNLYLPFLPCRLLMLGGLAWTGVTAVAWIFTSPEDVAYGWWIFTAVPFFLLILLKTPLGTVADKFLISIFPLKFDPVTDARSYGPIGASFLHTAWHLSHRPDSGISNTNTNTDANAESGCTWMETGWKSVLIKTQKDPEDPADQRNLPNIFLVQAESFCDPRIFSEAVPRDILKNWDLLRSEGQSGNLLVKSFGAYTLRTEYAVLTGTPPSSMGTYAFYPYLGALNTKVWSMAAYLQNLGYRTICLHPFHAEFFYRNKAIPNMGFEEFTTQENFPHSERWGPYISDKSVALSMTDLLKIDDRPVFCFAITMENHGPWLEGRLKNEFENGDAPNISNLDKQISRYLAHLANADQMIGMLKDGLSHSDRPGVLGWYGDHLPNLPQLITPGETVTPYLIWKTDSDSNRKILLNIRPEEMGGYLLSTEKDLVKVQKTER